MDGVHWIVLVGNVGVWLWILPLLLSLYGEMNNGRKEHGSLGNTDPPAQLSSRL